MPSCCGSGSSCSCKISAGPGIEVTGSGTAVDPFVLSASIGFEVTDTAQFDLTLTGTGESGNPYTLSVAYAATSKLDDVPDVNATSPANGQVLAWDAGTSTWVAANPTTAAAGSVQHNQSLSGDGSAGQPLAVVPYATRYLALFAANGIGITDVGINQMVRHFTDTVARSAASPAPTLNTLSMLDSSPGLITWWDGTQWAPLAPSFDSTYLGSTTEFLALSGPYAGSRLTHLVKQFSGSTDASGNVDILDNVDLNGRGGVLTCQFQETGALPFKMVVFANTDRVSGHAFNLVNGTPYASQAFTGIVDAWIY
jgi:hypothetical protein